MGPLDPLAFCAAKSYKLESGFRRVLFSKMW